MSSLRPEDQAFFDLVTRFLNEANAMNDTEHRSRISAALLFAAARFNAFTWMHREAMPEQTEAEAVEFFADHYKAMFKDNLAFLKTLAK
ncbi:MAG: DUF3144 domain-containing protein [Usitatibacter sp.]